MALQKYVFAYGRGTQSFEYDDADVLKVVRTEPQPVLEDVKGHLLDMLEHPIGLPPLSEIVKPGDTVAFICNDPTTALCSCQSSSMNSTASAYPTPICASSSRWAHTGR